MEKEEEKEKELRYLIIPYAHRLQHLHRAKVVVVPYHLLLFLPCQHLFP